MPKCLNITILDDHILEGTQSFQAHLSLSVPSKRRHVVDLGDGTTTVTILDDDIVSVRLLSLELVGREEDGDVEVCAEMEGGFDESADVEVVLQPVPLTATGKDRSTVIVEPS